MKQQSGSILCQVNESRNFFCLPRSTVKINDAAIQPQILFGNVEATPGPVY
jgi:hypothetical protein